LKQLIPGEKPGVTEPLERLAGLVEQATERLAGEPDAEARREAWELLDLVRLPAVLRRIPPPEVEGWAERLLRLVEASHYTVGPLFRQRASQYGSRTLFQLERSGPRGVWSWRRVAARVEFLSRLLLSLDPRERPAPVAILSENRIEVALLDLACLTAGIVNVMVPANATERDVLYILEHSGAGTLIASGPHQLAKVQPHRERLTGLKHVVALDAAAASPPDVHSLESLAPQAERIPRSEPRARGERVRIDELATVMYTSGTTGTPKGIQFSHRNIVFKRFARALALPEIGEKDVFLCFLPLYHTFGRFLEMLGCIFLGARYCFLEGTSPRNLMKGMQRHRPTVFISVPKKATRSWPPPRPR
jgi:long-subunit acyl-CoA synthetase (AMP-forming)